MVADGHLGIHAAAFVEAHFHRTLYSLIPPKLPDWENRKGEFNIGPLSLISRGLTFLAICVLRGRSLR